jgi:hypothetical protein
MAQAVIRLVETVVMCGTAISIVALWVTRKAKRKIKKKDYEDE